MNCKLLDSRKKWAYFYDHAQTNRFCIVQENVEPEVLKVQTELARSVQ